jgi:undecaprenyl diphosphate synthase
MHLLEQYMIEERATIMKQNIVVRVIGRRDGIPAATLAEMDRTIELSAVNTGTRLCLAINYGGRAEIVEAARRAIASGITASDLDEQRFSDFLYTAGQPDPDLLIRTSGEMRVSNFLLWQIAYAEIWVTETLWPDFRRRHLLEAVIAYQKRDRRYGGIKPSPVALGVK